jgi:hypothetical protein
MVADGRRDPGMSPVVKVSREHLRVRRQSLLDRLGLSFDSLEAKAEAYALTPEEQLVWEELGDIGFLLGWDAQR